MTNSQHHSLLIWHVRDCLTLSFSRTATAKDCFNYFSCYCYLKSTRFFHSLEVITHLYKCKTRSWDSTKCRATLRIYNRNYGSHVWASNFTQEGITDATGSWELLPELGRPPGNPPENKVPTAHVGFLFHLPPLSW